MTGSPSNMGAGYVVRLRCGGGGLTYSTPRMTKANAEAAADGLEDELACLEDADMMHFASDFFGVVRVRAERITAIEVVRSLIGAPPRVGATNGSETR